MTPELIFDNLKILAPSVAFSVEREIDYDFVWDGDGEEPDESPYDVEVIITTIDAGEIETHSEWLGGCYFADDEPIGDVHGYLPQMLLDSAENLLMCVATDDIVRQLQSVIQFLKAEQSARYAEQMKSV